MSERIEPMDGAHWRSAHFHRGTWPKFDDAKYIPDMSPLNLEVLRDKLNEVINAMNKEAPDDDA